jgi:hypothetical protein
VTVFGLVARVLGLIALAVVLVVVWRLLQQRPPPDLR